MDFGSANGTLFGGRVLEIGAWRQEKKFRVACCVAADVFQGLSKDKFCQRKTGSDGLASRLSFKFVGFFRVSSK